VKISFVKEIASKFASADFQNFCRLASKKSVVVFGLDEHWTPGTAKSFLGGAQFF